MYYVIKKSYIGPNSDEAKYVDASTIEIRTVPARYVGDGDVCIDGHCGSYGDFAIDAFGEYETLEEAEAAIAKTFGDVRDCNREGVPWDCDDDDTIAIYKPGKYAPLSAEASVAMAWPGIEEDVRADSTDEELEVLLEEYEKEAIDQLDSTLDTGAVWEAMKQRRDYLRKEAEDEDEDED